jgi:hypothetical protein
MMMRMITMTMMMTTMTMIMNRNITERRRGEELIKKNCSAGNEGD